MREPINDRLADGRDITIDNTQPEHKTPAERRQIGNDPDSYMFEGYKIHERFDREGPPFADCIVRVFS